MLAILKPGCVQIVKTGERCCSRNADAQAQFDQARALTGALADELPDDALRASLRAGFAAQLPDARPHTALQTARNDFDGLTAREREVAALVALGKTNRAIAEQLVVSERTIEKHVENATGKLGFSARAQLAVWAAARGLTERAA